MLADPEEVLRRLAAAHDAESAYLAVCNEKPSVLIEALRRSRDGFHRERLCIALAHHDLGAQAARGLPSLVEAVGDDDRATRESAASAVASLTTRVHPDALRQSVPDVRDILSNAKRRRRGTGGEIETARDAVGLNSTASWHRHDRRFAEVALEVFEFLSADRGFTAVTRFRTDWSTSVVLWGSETALDARWDQRDDVVDVRRIILIDESLPMYLDRSATHYLGPWELPGGPLETIASTTRRDHYGVLRANAERLSAFPELCRDDAVALAEAIHEATLPL